MLENFGLRVLAEHPYQLIDGPNAVRGSRTSSSKRAICKRADVAALEPLFKEAFLAAWRGEIENDGFNRLLLCASLERARNRGVARLLPLPAADRHPVQPGVHGARARRAGADHALAGAAVRDAVRARRQARARARRSASRKGILRALDKVASLDEDRILRGYLAVIRATLRTNYYQTRRRTARRRAGCRSSSIRTPSPTCRCRARSSRSSSTARASKACTCAWATWRAAALRWSDRREDFRTEVLGLMKAQNVKNTVIVPVGAKGGFYPKRLPAGGSREDVQKEVIASYQTFIRGLLDVTDNIVNGKTVVRPGVVRRDGDDAYLVVAADKGTATFSDIANAISIEYGHWLGDAFASGGSAGYDHKGMGITARGAWECVKRHFREIGRRHPVAGIHLRRHRRHVGRRVRQRHAAVEAHPPGRGVRSPPHLPRPESADAAASFRERERLFKLPRSSWDDYSRKADFARRRRLAAQRQIDSAVRRGAASCWASTRAAATPGGGHARHPAHAGRPAVERRHRHLREGQRRIARAKCATAPTTPSAPTAARSAPRWSAKAATSAARSAAASNTRSRGRKAGGRINTDFIDNSAGVNTSDLEVNIKILLADVARKRQPHARRARQTTRQHDGRSRGAGPAQQLPAEPGAVGARAARARAADRIPEPDPRAGAQRQSRTAPSNSCRPTTNSSSAASSASGLTRPELAVVLAYSKIWLSNHLLDSDLPDDPYFASEVQRYFPAPMRRRYSREIPQHRLRREIVATATTNSLVNRMGPVFVTRAQEDTDADPAVDLARLHDRARNLLDARRCGREIEALDNTVPANVQYGMFYRAGRLLRHTSYWLLRERGKDLHIENAVRELRAGVEALVDSIDTAMLRRRARTARRGARRNCIAGGVPEKLARRIARLSLLESRARHRGARARRSSAGRRRWRAPISKLGVALGLDWLHREIDRLTVDGSWQATARTGLRDAAMRAHRELTQQVLRTRGAKRAGERLERWSAAAR